MKKLFFLLSVFMMIQTVRVHAADSSLTMEEYNKIQLYVSEVFRQSECRKNCKQDGLKNIDAKRKELVEKKEGVFNKVCEINRDLQSYQMFLTSPSSTIDQLQEHVRKQRQQNERLDAWRKELKTQAKQWNNDFSRLYVLRSQLSKPSSVLANSCTCLIRCVFSDIKVLEEEIDFLMHHQTSVYKAIDECRTVCTGKDGYDKFSQYRQEAISLEKRAKVLQQDCALYKKVIMEQSNQLVPPIVPIETIIWKHD